MPRFRIRFLEQLSNHSGEFAQIEDHRIATVGYVWDLAAELLHPCLREDSESVAIPWAR